MEYQLFAIFMSINVSITLVMILAACLCCKKKTPKNDEMNEMGLEGTMVKLKNPDDVVVVTTGSQNDLNLSTTSNVDSEKRVSCVATHRSLPDIPVADNNDNESEMYETVADKRLVDQKAEDKSPTSSIKKQPSVSQHSSISQADDVSSPYSRVKNSPHDYAKVCSAEHPYAQLNAPITSNTHGNDSEVIHENGSVSRNGSSQNLLQMGAVGPAANERQQEIPAASAIAGMVSASQDLPYMTPPIASQVSYFSGDSQDSSKGYTSISVREPLANILAQSSKPRNPTLPIRNDSHYATVSDDSDETYAAIEDPNNRIGRTEIYTSGSETYAQIQPMMVNPIVVAVEINNAPTNIATGSSGNSNLRLNDSLIVNDTHVKVNSSELTPIPPPVDNLRAQMHSRQASSSSNNSSMGNLSSPKPEKRQANSPLPPTPKGQQPLACSSNNLTSTSSSIASGRNSVASVIEYTLESYNEEYSKKIRSLSPSKDIEGMYAKVMKKNKLVNTSSSQNNSPVLPRKLKENHSILTMNAVETDGNHSRETNTQMKPFPSNSLAEKVRTRSNSYSAKDHGYETIPADTKKTERTVENRKSDCYANILQKERLSQPGPSSRCPPQIDTKSSGDIHNPPSKDYESLKALSSNDSDPGYETLIINNDDNKKIISEPNYEVLKPSKYDSADDGYAKVLEKPRIKFDDNSDGYTKVKGEDDTNISGYSTIKETKILYQKNPKNHHHNYASISETIGQQRKILESSATCSNKSRDIETLDIYMRIPGVDFDMGSISGDAVDRGITVLTSITSTNNSLKTSSNTINNISTSTSSHQILSSNYESLTGSESDPNYESVCYLNKRESSENPYERLKSDSNVSSDIQLNGPSPSPGNDTDEVNPKQQANTAKKINGPKNDDYAIEPNNDSNGLVDDYFQV